ncbi:hypothetical protein BHE74_00030879 [Ensete ventricosum]|nr:hypothetical protein BHE74_00030879 [Ensete ventricosum]
MADQYLLGAVFASILGFLLLLVGFHGSKGRARRTAGKCGSGPLVPGDGGTEVIIVGAGVAGSALAYTLGKDGRSVHVIERDLSEPDRIVGELLQPGGYLKLLELGLEAYKERYVYILCGSFQVPTELRDAFVAAIDKGSIRSMPNRSMPAAPHPTPGALLMGDAFNMRHPLTGGGMTVALSDIVVLRNLLKPLHNNLHDAAALCKYLESFYTLRKPVASTINTLAGALYKVFSASPADQARNEMRQACFDYLSLGGVFSNGPIALLSGLNPRPLSLVAHFFAVAIYGVGRLLLPFPSLKRLWIGARLISVSNGLSHPEFLVCLRFFC